MQFSVENFKKETKKVINQNQIPGVGIGLNHQGGDFYKYGFGFRNLEEKLPVTGDTVFGIASMTKSFTCMAIMKLQEDGMLNVHDKIIKYLPEFNIPNEEFRGLVTIHHLMTHTAGLPPLSTHKFARKRSVDQDPSAKDYGLDLVSDDEEPIDTYEEFINYIANQDFSLLGAPGTQFSYSNDFYGLLGVIIARVSGQSYESYVEENILKPAQMTNSFFDINEIENRENVTMLYMAKNEGSTKKVYPAPLWWDAPSMRAAGYLKSTVNDILNYLEIIRNDGVVHSTRILSSESVNQMIYPHVEVEPGRFYGYGLSITPDYFGTTLITHGGGLKGVSSFMTVIPEKELTGVVLTNLSGVPVERILRGAINLTLDKKFSDTPMKYNEKTIAENQLEKYTGSFTSGEGMNLKVTIENKQLVLYDGSSEGVSLSYIGEDMFITPRLSVVRFIKDNNEQVVRVFYSSRQIFKDTK